MKLGLLSPCAGIAASAPSGASTAQRYESGAYLSAMSRSFCSYPRPNIRRDELRSAALSRYGRS